MAKGTKGNPISSKPLTELLLVQLSEVDDLPNWAVTKCYKAGVRTVADLYRVRYLNAARPGFGPKFSSLAGKMLTRLGLVDRIGLQDPITAVAREAELKAALASEAAMPQLLAEHEALVLARCEQTLADNENYHREKTVRVIKNFRRRERIMADALTRVTREEFAFTAPDVSPESASRWLALRTAGRVRDGFVAAANLKCVTSSGIEFIRKMNIHFSAVSIARLLVAFGKDELVGSNGRFAAEGSTVGDGAEGIASNVEAMFVARSGGQLAMLEGVVIIEGMSTAQIKDLFKAVDPA